MTSLHIFSAFYFVLSIVGLFFMTKSDNLSADIAFWSSLIIYMVLKSATIVIREIKGEIK